MSLTKRMFFPAMIIALAIAFVPVLNFTGLGADNAYAAAKLKAPAKVTATAVAQDAVKVSWGKVKGAKGYTVYQKKGSKFKAVKTVKAKAVTIKKLAAGDYTFQVKAFAKKGKKKVYGKASKKATVTLLAPVEGQTAACSNGQFIGTQSESGVLSFKGIPYAKAPTGALRWQAPEAPAKSTAVKSAEEFGNPSVQANYPLPDPAQGDDAVSWVFDGSKYQVSEDCLTLNVWTKDINPAEKKPVMVWFHGGGFVVGSTTNDAYQLENFCENQDMIMVSVNYRLGIFGSADMSAVPEGKKFKTEDFTESQNLALLDDIQALEWIQENIAAFGGDPSNVTIFGNSAGAADITILTTANNERIQNAELFKRVIAQSGGLALCVPDDGGKYTAERTGEVQNLIDRVNMLEGFNVKNLDDLMAVPEDKLIQAYTGYPTNKGNLVDVNFYDPSGEEFITGAALCYDNVYTPVYNDDAGLLPKDPYVLAEEGYGKNIDVMYGSNQNEWNYWIWEMAEFDPTADHPVPMLDVDYEDYAFGMIPLQKMAGDLSVTLTKEEMDTNVAQFMALPRVAAMKQEAQTRTDDQWKTIVSRIYYVAPDQVTDDMIAQFKAAEENVWMHTELYNDLVFRAPATKAAAAHADASAGKAGKTYMYYWAKETDQKYQKAGHASEISYVMGNPNHTCFSGHVDMALSAKIQGMWADFARTGDPGQGWTEYDSTNRATMTMDLDDDGALKMVNDPLKEQRELVEPLLKYHLK